MAKTILIPTDFSIESLIMIKKAVQLNPAEEVQIVLMYCSLLPGNSITDLLFYTPDKIITKQMGKEFQEALSILLNKYTSEIVQVYIEVFHGTTHSAFDNFIKGNRITEALIPKNYQLNTAGNSFDPIPYILKSGLTYQEIEWAENPFIHASLASIFLD
jgi:hypothetical protein